MTHTSVTLQCLSVTLRLLGDNPDICNIAVPSVVVRLLGDIPDICNIVVPFCDIEVAR